MVLKIEDRVRETTTTTGTGTYSLGGEVAGFQSFVTAIGDGNTTYYAVVNRSADEWELGIGTVADATPDTLARTTVISSSNSDNAVSFSAGTKDVFVTLPSSKSTFINGSNSLVIGNGAAGVDYSLTFDGESNDGVITWKEDEDYFEFSDDILMNGTEKIQFGDTASFIQQSTNGTLRIDGEAIIDLNASTRVDVSGDLKVGGEVQTASIGFTDGDNAITIADGGGITAHNGITSLSPSNTFGATSFNDSNITNVGSIALDSISFDAGNGTAIIFNQGVKPATQTTSVSGDFEPDFSQYTNFILTVSNSGNCTLTTPADPDEVAGQSGVFLFIQQGTGGGTLTHANDTYRTAGGTAITLSTAANARDIVPYFVEADGTVHLGAAQLAFADA